MSSGAGVIFGVSGGVTEAVLRRLVEDSGMEALNEIKFTGIRGTDGIKEAVIPYGDRQIKIAVVSGLKNADELIQKIKSGEVQYDFVEVMACPGGCIGGGGQPLQSIKNSKQIRESRIDSIYNKDNESNIKESFMNPLIQDAYISYISKNNVELHTKCEDLEKIKE